MFKTRRLPPSPAKLQGTLPAAAGPVSVIVKVQTPGHVPAAARLRSRIDETLFTAEIASDRMAEVTADPDVVSVSVASSIRPVRS